MRRRQLEKHMRFVQCSSCQGDRLNRQSRAVVLKGSTDQQAENRKRAGRKKRSAVPAIEALTLSDVCRLDIASAAAFFENLELDETQQFIAEEVLKEIRGRLGFLLRCGLNYLTLERTAPTLSGGESQRIRLAGQIGCGLVDVVYILDEPSIGLHPRDNDRLIGALLRLRDAGNTVVVVEHDMDFVRSIARTVTVLHQGSVLAEGRMDQVQNDPKVIEVYLGD